MRKLCVSIVYFSLLDLAVAKFSETSNVSLKCFGTWRGAVRRRRPVLYKQKSRNRQFDRGSNRDAKKLPSGNTYLLRHPK
jgi:hypothetical protein